MKNAAMRETHNRPASLVLSVILLSASSIQSPAQVLFSENFESGSIFPLVGGFSRSSLTGVRAAPNTSPPLPINAGGDLELRYEDASFTHVQTFAPGDYTNVRIEGYVGLGFASNAGADAGFILRATGWGDYYVAYVMLNSGAFCLCRSAGGIVGLSPPFLPWVPIPDFDPFNENYHIIFEANGPNLFASISRVSIVNGAVSESFLGSISGTDDALASGQVGLYAFARFSNSAFFDDVTVSLIPEPHTLSLSLLGLLMLARLGAVQRKISRCFRQSAPS